MTIGESTVSLTFIFNALMPEILHCENLHDEYRTASMEDAISMANMGAICYRAFKSGLYKEWTVTMTGDDEIRAELWRTEGRQSLLSSVNDLRIVSEEAQARATAAEGRLQQLRESVETEAARRVTEIIDGHRKDIETAKMGEITALKERIAAAEGRESLIPLLNKTVTLMESELKHHKLKLEEALAVTRESEKVKSSHAIGPPTLFQSWKTLEQNMLSEIL